MKRMPWFTLATMSFLFAGCTGNPGHTAPNGLSDTGGPALHAVRDTQLRELMAEVNNLMFDRMRTELELDQERRKKMQKIAETAAQMQKTIVYIIETRPRLALSPNEQTVFLTLADTLRSRVKTLEEQARRNYVDAIPDTFERIESTCMACHQLFRSAESSPQPGARR